jgi:hypothetical protein
LKELLATCDEDCLSPLSKDSSISMEPSSRSSADSFPEIYLPRQSRSVRLIPSAGSPLCGFWYLFDGIKCQMLKRPLKRPDRVYPLAKHQEYACDGVDAPPTACAKLVQFQTDQGAGKARANGLRINY